MNIHDIALLVAVAIPVATVVALNVLLTVAGEKGTLLIPVSGPFASIAVAEDPVAAEAAAEPEVDLEPLRKAA